VGDAARRKKLGVPRLHPDISREEKLTLVRQNTELWYPTADDLQLRHVPDAERERIRTRLAPWLKNLRDIDGKRTPVKFGDCWNVAQSLAITAQSPDVKYIEGAWGGPRYADTWDEYPPAHHGWNTVEGFRVDLVAEFFQWQHGHDDHDYEAQKEYTYEEVKSFLDYVGCWEIMTAMQRENEDWFPVSTPIPEPDWDKVDSESPEGQDYYTKRNNFIFQAATDRLIARLRESSKNENQEDLISMA
jgi:hypothetical protein